MTDSLLKQFRNTQKAKQTHLHWTINTKERAYFFCTYVFDCSVDTGQLLQKKVHIFGTCFRICKKPPIPPPTPAPTIPPPYVSPETLPHLAMTSQKARGRERAIVNQTNTATVSKATLGKLLRDGVELIWACPST